MAGEGGHATHAVDLEEEVLPKDRTLGEEEQSGLQQQGSGAANDTSGQEWDHHHSDDYGWDDQHFDHWSDYSIHEPVKGFIDIDAHVLGTPAIADLDGDGTEELVLGMSFFFEREYYDRPEHRWEMPKDIDLGKYVASAVVVWDMRGRTEKWRTHLDLSTDTTEYRAYILGSPVVADANRDGRMEVIVGTSAGFVYMLDFNGTTMPGWPVEVGEWPASCWATAAAVPL